MKTINIDNVSEIIILSDGSVFIIRSYCFDVNILYKLSYPELTFIHSGTYAFCYDYVWNIEYNVLRR